MAQPFKERAVLPQATLRASRDEASGGTLTGLYEISRMESPARERRLVF